VADVCWLSLVRSRWKRWLGDHTSPPKLSCILLTLVLLNRWVYNIYAMNIHRTGARQTSCFSVGNRHVGERLCATFKKTKWGHVNHASGLTCNLNTLSVFLRDQFCLFRFFTCLHKMHSLSIFA
jgi:hypothetical protein